MIANYGSKAACGSTYIRKKGSIYGIENVDSRDLVSRLGRSVRVLFVLLHR